MTSGASSFDPSGKYISSELLEIAIELAQNGDKKAIRELLKLIVKEDPTDELAWIWYANTSPTIQERIQTLEEFRKQNPENQRIEYLCASLSESITKETEVHPPPPPDLSTPTESLAALPIPSPDAYPLQLSFLDQPATELSQSETNLQNTENNGSSKHHLGLALDFYISGDKEGAKELLEAITRKDPQNELAWIWYANTFPTPQERIQTLYKYLTLNPKNQRVHAYCNFLRTTFETSKKSTPSEYFLPHAQSDDIFKTELPASTPDPELGLVNFLHCTQYFQILTPSTQTPTCKSKPILIGLSKSARQLRCPNCLRYHVVERYPINWKSSILNVFLLLISFGLWTIYLLRTGILNRKLKKKFICTACGYTWR